MTKKRNRTKPTGTFEERLSELAQKSKAYADKLPSDSKAREVLLQRARQLETTLRINKWLSSPGQQAVGARENFLVPEER